MKNKSFIGFIVSLVLMLAVAMPVGANQMVLVMDAQGHTPDEEDERLAMAELAAEYEALTGVKIEFYEVPEAIERTTWVQSRMMTQDAPDIFWWNFDWTWQHYQKGWFVNYTPYMDKPNPYISGNERWEDTFVPGILDRVRAPDGNLYVIPADGVGVAIYYNPEIFAEVGVDVPETWGEFMDIQEKIQEAGYIPFAISAGANDVWMHWVDQLVHGQFLYDRMDEWDTSGNMYLEDREIVKGVIDGTFPDPDILKETWRLIKEWSAFWPRGFTSEIDTEQMFITGSAAMYLDGSWMLPVFAMAELDFEVGAFHVPVITEEDAPLASGTNVKIYGPWGAAQYIIPGYIADRDPERLEVIMDFIHFLTTPENIARISESHGGTIPNIQGAPVGESMAVFMEPIEDIVIQGFHGKLHQTFRDATYRAIQNYLTDQTTLDQFIDRLIRNYNDVSRRLARENPDWVQ